VTRSCRPQGASPWRPHRPRNGRDEREDAADTDSEVTGTTHLRVGKGQVDSAFFAHVTHQYTDTFTNPANGKFLVIEGHAVFQETKAIPVEGTVFRFIDAEAGQVVVLRDNRRARRAARPRRHPLVHSVRHARDDTPGGEELEDRVTIRLAGPHPSVDEEVFCAAVENLIG
jgi:hypothetical protein